MPAPSTQCGWVAGGGGTRGWCFMTVLLVVPAVLIGSCLGRVLGIIRLVDGWLTLSTESKVLLNSKKTQIVVVFTERKTQCSMNRFCLMLKSWLIYLRACSCKCIYSRLNELIKRYWCCTLEEKRDSSVSSSGECLKLFTSCVGSLHRLRGTIAHLFHLEFEMNRTQFYVPDYLLTCWSNKTKLAKRLNEWGIYYHYFTIYHWKFE